MQTTLLTYLKSYTEPWLLFISEDPLMRMWQGSLLLIGILAVFLVFYTTRDVILRTHSFLYMLFSILLVALLPGVGFLLYILIRPARTIKERELEKMVRDILRDHEKQAKAKKQQKKTVKV
ncbi:hypothetical protein KJ996_01430 [Patescibacteria group bacterium]|nr:hypothetical protein [Patescibacteria group bacterium]